MTDKHALLRPLAAETTGERDRIIQSDWPIRAVLTDPTDGADNVNRLTHVRFYAEREPMTDQYTEERILKIRLEAAELERQAAMIRLDTAQREAKSAQRTIELTNQVADAMIQREGMALPN